MIPECRICGEQVKVGQVFVGWPLIKMVGVGESQFSGGEILTHAGCLLRMIEKLKVELIKPS